MVTKAQREAAEAKNDDKAVDTSETVPAGTQTTSDKAEKTEAPTSVEKREDAEKRDEAQEDLFEEDFSGDSDFPGALGTVKEGDYDVPWSYLTADDFDEDSDYNRTSDSDDGDVRKWTAQQAFETENDDEVVVLVPVQATPGQTFAPSELPEIDSLVKAGIDPVQYLSGLPVRAQVEDGYGEGTRRRGIPA